MQEEVRKLRIEPRHIKIEFGLSSTFGKTEREACAEFLIHFCQARGSFGDFRRSELAAWVRSDGFLYFGFGVPREPMAIIAEAEYDEWLEYDDRGQWAFDVSFLRKCYFGAKRNLIWHHRNTSLHPRTVRRIV